MNDYKELIERLISASERNSNSLNTRSTCKDAADAIEQLIKERDAAVADCKIILEDGVQCNICKHYFSENVEACLECENKSNFEWRGVQEDNR